MDPKYHHGNNVNIIGWNPNENRHIISLVGDKLKDALEVNSLYFGSGSGHFTGLAYLTKMIVKNNNITIP